MAFKVNVLAFFAPNTLNSQHMTMIDHINQKILHILEKDGRISNSDLAEKIGLSPSACLRRVQELERTGVIKGYRAIIDPEAVGNGLTVYVAVGLSRHLKEDQDAFQRAMELAPQVRECHNVAGAFEYMLRVEVPNLTAYKHFHSEVLGVVEQVVNITSYMVMESSKDMRA